MKAKRWRRLPKKLMEMLSAEILESKSISCLQKRKNDKVAVSW